MSDLISRQDAIDALDEQIEQCDKALSSFDISMRDGFAVKVERASLVAFRETLEYLPSAQPEIVRCKDCKYWVPGYITDNDDFIPPKCGEWQQMVGHSSDDYCSLAERREVTT